MSERIRGSYDYALYKSTTYTMPHWLSEIRHPQKTQRALSPEKDRVTSTSNAYSTENFVKLEHAIFEV